MAQIQSKHTKDARSAIINITLATPLLLLQSWISDGIEGNELFHWLVRGLKLGEQTISTAVLLLGMTVLAIGLTWALYQRRRTFLPIQIQRIGEPDGVDPHAILVMTVSNLGVTWRVDLANKLIFNNGKSLSLDGTLDDVLTRLAGERERFSWEQLLRAMRKHAEGGQLRQVYLVGSPGDQGTAAKFIECRDLLCLCFPSIKATEFQREEVGFEDIDGLLGLYRSIIQRAGKGKSQVMIDVTGGTKVVSIAAAIVTMEYPDIEFQYVETQGKKRVRSFNVTGSGYDDGQ